MIVPRNSTATTMKKALAYSIAALNAAGELDIDRKKDASFFATERDTLQPHLNDVKAKERAVEDDELDNAVRLQARVSLGDAVLDRSVVDSKERMKLELKRSDPEAADKVFGARTTDITRAPIAIEPSLVATILVKLMQGPDFPGKDMVRSDLEARMNQQNTCLKERSDGDIKSTQLRSAMQKSIELASDALYTLEKRLLERFPRDADYVRKFFYDVSYSRRQKEETAESSEPSQK